MTDKPRIITAHYRPTYDTAQWERNLARNPPTDPRMQLLVPACAAVTALCDEVDRLQAAFEQSEFDAVQLMRSTKAEAVTTDDARDVVLKAYEMALDGDTNGALLCLIESLESWGMIDEDGKVTT